MASSQLKYITYALHLNCASTQAKIKWIPEHHLKARGGKKKAGATSGDDLSGAETSGTEGKRRKGRK